MLSRILNIFKKNSINKESLELKSLVGKNILINNRKKYPNIKNIIHAEEKIFSQNGEDGIIDFILETLKIKNPKFIEIGVENYVESNTRLLYHIRNSSGLIVDQSININNLSKNLDLWKGRLKVLKENVTPENINEIISKDDYNKDLDLFSIDIDGLDYWVIKKLPNNFSKICVAEYNPLFGSDLKITVPNIENFYRTEYHYSNLCWGVSLKALINIMNDKNFIFIGTNSMKNNAFFVNNDFKDLFKEILSSLNTNLDQYVNHDFKESRDEKGKLTYLSRLEQLIIIKDCNVINLDKSSNEKIKISELFNL